MLHYKLLLLAKNITAPSAKPGTWLFSRLAFSEENFEPSSVTPVEKELHNQEISFPFSSVHVAQIFWGLAKIAFHQNMCIHSQNLDQDVTEDKGRR
jgi:hypothetical protein